MVLHFLPPYCPDDNRIERVWLDLHANVTRNHRCKSIDELMVHVISGEPAERILEAPSKAEARKRMAQLQAGLGKRPEPARIGCFSRPN